jgi:UPF0176 protein
MTPAVVASFYRFVAVDAPGSLREELLELLLENRVRGTVLVAREGINGTVAGSRAGIDAVRERLLADARFQGLSYKEAPADRIPFYRTRVKVKREIVTIGVEDLDPTRDAGTYVNPSEWNDLISDPDVFLIDARNEYEIRIGTFEGAVNPHTDSFRELPAYLDAHRTELQDRKIAMFCTGGIRCEKSTAYLRSLGFEDVFHLRGGILKYLETIDESESLWRGECFVFDERVSVDHSLQSGTFVLCRACRTPLFPAEREDPRYAPGVSCPHCFDRKTDRDRSRYRERERQVALARERGETHIGPGDESNPESDRI